MSASVPRLGPVSRGLTRQLGQRDMFGWDDPPPVPPDEPDNVRTLLFRDGLATLRRLTGKPEQAARGLLGRLLRDARDDASLVASALARADDIRPAEAVAWIVAAVRTLANPRRSTLDRIADEWGLVSIEDLDAGAAVVEARAEPAPAAQRPALTHQGEHHRGR